MAGILPKEVHEKHLQNYVDLAMRLYSKKTETREETNAVFERIDFMVPLALDTLEVARESGYADLVDKFTEEFKHLGFYHNLPPKLQKYSQTRGQRISRVAVLGQ